MTETMEVTRARLARGVRPRSTLEEAAALLPTPAASQFNDGESPESWQARNDRLRELKVNGNGMGTPLAIAVQLLKTPTAQLAVNGGSQHPDKRRAGGHGPTLADQVEHSLPPTPQAADGRAGAEKEAKGQRPSGSKRSLRMATAVRQLLPTPRATDGTKGGPNQRGSSGDLMLPSAVMDLLPTPDATHGRKTTRTSLLLPGAVEALSNGASTSPRSAAGNESSGALHQGQLSLGEPESG